MQAGGGAKQPSPSHHLQSRLQHFPNLVDTCPQWRVDQVGIALGGSDLGMSQPPPDHFRRCAAGDQQRGEGVAKVVDANVGDVGLHPHPFPEALDINHRLPGYIAGEEEGAALGHGRATQADQRNCLVRDRHTVYPALFGPECQIDAKLFSNFDPGRAWEGSN